MKNLFQFVQKNYVGISFILLQSFSLFLFFTYNPYQRSFFLNTYYDVYGAIYKKVYAWRQYLYLSKENKILNEELARIKSFSRQSLVKKYEDNIIIRDTLFSQRYVYMPANVIYHSFSSFNNTLMIDKGGLNGVEPDMGIILPNGVVGIIKTVSKNYAAAFSIFNTHVSISVQNSRTRHCGLMYWDGQSTKYTLVKDIPLHAPVQVNDTFVTSPYSLIFPQGIPIGRVVEITHDDAFKKIKLELFCDMHTIQQVLVVKDLSSDEIQNLQKNIVKMQEEE